MLIRHTHRGGFALPTVLIASIVMLTILAVSVSSVTAVRTTLKAQYYEQLAKVAGEAGVAYAKACLAKNGNVPQWSNANPLRPSTDCSGNTLAGLSCPSDARCWVLLSGNMRSSFSVPAPELDSQGKAITISNSGFVDLLRESNGQVWRTYRQPSVQAAAVPDLCSGSAKSGFGWSNAVAASPANAVPLYGTATPTITLSDSNLPAGAMYFRKDFVVTKPGSYAVWAGTNTTKDHVQLYIDGVLAVTASGSSWGEAYNLDVGCHTITAKLTNKTINPSYSQFSAALYHPSGTSPILTTDTSWRVSAGAPVSFATSNFYADPSIWTSVTNYDVTHAQTANTSWTTMTGDAFTPLISPSGNGCPSACPANATNYLRDSKDFYLAADTEVVVSTMCDNACAVYVDGTIVANVSFVNTSAWVDIIQHTITLPRGYHRLGVQLYNALTSANPSGVAVSVANKSSGLILARTDTSWQAANAWTAGVGSNISAYETTFTPSPREITPPVTADVLVIGGGGGGGRNAAGGGGAGGVRFIENFSLAVRTYNVTIGGGGAGSTDPFVVGVSGNSTTFGDYTSLGGGGGASRDGGANPASGGSGGGGSGATASPRHIGGAGAAGQGNRGGTGTTPDASTNSTAGGGGGAGNVGVNAVAGTSSGNGGAGRIYYIDGTRLAVAGGGGGGLTSAVTAGVATDGGGAGSFGAASAATANTGGGGGGGGGAGAAGGSGVVLLRIRTGSATVNTTGSPAISTTTINGIGYTIYKFTGNGTFVVTALAP